MSWFDAYHPYAQHLEWLSHLAGQFPAHSRLVTAGQSYQGRNISGIHIFGHSGGGHRPAVIMHSTVHAREWITTVTLLPVRLRLILMTSPAMGRW